MVLSATAIAVVIYLYTEHKGFHEKKYVFERVFINDPSYQIMESKRIDPDSFRTKLGEAINIKNAISYINVDSSTSFVSLVGADSTISYPSGIYRLEGNNQAAISDSCLICFDLYEKKYSNYKQKLLAYDCKLSRSDNYLLVIFLHFSDIIIFNSDGKLIKRIKTKDNVPPPSIITNGTFTYFERGKAFNTNRAAFIHKHTLYVFSLRNEDRQDMYLVDCYNIDGGKYEYSFWIKNVASEDNQTVENATLSGNILTIESRNCITKIEMK